MEGTLMKSMIAFILTLLKFPKELEDGTNFMFIKSIKNN